MFRFSIFLHFQLFPLCFPVLFFFFQHFSFFIHIFSFCFFFFFSFDAENGKNRRKVPTVQMTIFLCETSIFSRQEGGVCGSRNGPFEGGSRFHSSSLTIDVSSVVGAPRRCGVLTTWGGIAGIALGRLFGREHASTPQSGVAAPCMLKRSLPRLYYCCCCGVVVLWCCCCCVRHGNSSTQFEFAPPSSRASHHHEVPSETDEPATVLFPPAQSQYRAVFQRVLPISTCRRKKENRLPPLPETSPLSLDASTEATKKRHATIAQRVRSAFHFRSSVLSQRVRCSFSRQREVLMTAHVEPKQRNPFAES